MLDHYAILGIARNASVSEIRKAYYTMAHRWQPDKNRGNEKVAEQKLEEISIAFGILSDPDMRAQYDRTLVLEQTNSGGDGNNGISAPRSSGGGNVCSCTTSTESESFCGIRFGFSFNKRAQYDQTLGQTSSGSSGGGNNGFSSPRYFGGGTVSSCTTSTENIRFYGFGFNFSGFSLGSFIPRWRSYSSSTVTSIVNGRRVVTKTVVENGVTTVTVRENGVLVSKKVNGIEQVAGKRNAHITRK